MRVLRKAKSIRETWKEAGFGATATYAIDKLLRALRFGRAHCYLFVCQPVVVNVDNSLLARNLIWRELSNDDIHLLGMSPDVASFRIKQNSVAVGVFKESQVIAVLWYTLGDFTEDEVRAVYRPEPKGIVAWDFGVEVVPQYRLGRAFVTLWAAAMRSMHARDCEFTLSRINAVNSPSVRSHKRMGANVIGYANFVCIGRIQFAWSSHTPRLHVSLSEQRRPCYVLRPDNNIR